MTPSPLHIVKPRLRGVVAHAKEIVDFLHPDITDKIRGQALLLQQGYDCPFLVKDHDGFVHVILGYHEHYEEFFYGIKPGTRANRALAKSAAFEFMERCLGNYHGGMRTAERNAIEGRAGGMLEVISSITEGIAKHHITLYVHSVFREFIPPNEFDLRLRITEELLARIAMMFPNERLLPAQEVVGKLEEIIMQHVHGMHELRKLYRY